MITSNLYEVFHSLLWKNYVLTYLVESLRRMVQRELPASVYRCKGIILATDSPGKRLALQVVGRRTEITELGDWGERTPRSQIVAIGAAIDTEELNLKFESCIDLS